MKPQRPFVGILGALVAVVTFLALSPLAGAAEGTDPARVQQGAAVDGDSFEASVQPLSWYGGSKRKPVPVFPRTRVVRDAVVLKARVRERHVRRAELVVVDSAGRVVFRRDVDRERRGRIGRNVRFTARRGGVPLPAGLYRAAVRGEDRAGNVGRSRWLRIEVSADRLAWTEETTSVRPVEGSTSPYCPIHGGTGPNGCGDEEFQPCGTVLPSERYECGLSHRSGECTERQEQNEWFALSQHLVEFPDAVRGVDAMRVSFTGSPTFPGESDQGRLGVGPGSVTSTSSATSEWTSGTAYSGGYRDPNYPGANLRPSAYWTFGTEGTDAFDVASFTVSVRYLAVR